MSTSTNEPSADVPRANEDETPKKRKKWKRPDTRARKIARVLAYFAGVATVIGAVAAGSAYADVKDGMLEVGQELGSLDHIGSKTPIHLNGQPIFVGSQVLQMSVSDALDRAETLCVEGDVENPGQSGYDTPQSALDTAEREPVTKLREEQGDRGAVVCFAPEDGEVVDGIGDKLDRYMAFLKSGNLEDLGRLRYFFAKETPDGHTHLVRVWTEGSFDFYAMAPPNGEDAPGTDPDDMPRPPEARRLLSATTEGSVYAARVYQTALAPEALAAAYDTSMVDRGWDLELARGTSRVYQRKQVSVFVTPIVKDGRTLVSLVHMGYDPEVVPVAADAR